MKKKQGGKQLDVETFVLSKSSMVPDYYPVENAQEYSSDGPEEK